MSASKTPILTPLFIAGGSAERAAVAAMMRKCEAMGYRVTCDWPAMMDEHPIIESAADACEIATTLEQGIVGAAIVWVMLPAAKSEGSAYELGYVRGLLRGMRREPHKPTKLVIVSGADLVTLGRVYPPFVAAQHVYLERHEDVLNYLAKVQLYAEEDRYARVHDLPWDGIVSGD